MDKTGESPLEKPVDILKSSDPKEIAQKSGVTWETASKGEGQFTVPVLNNVIKVSHPGIIVKAPPEFDSFPLRLLTLLYLSKSNGKLPSGSWVAFREVPGGRFYEPVVASSVESPVAKVFGNDLTGFSRAARSFGGRCEDYGDAAFSFVLFPHVLLNFIIWKADDEFSARAKVLFDANSHNHLSAFDLRMGAQEISGRLIRAKDEKL